ncbi:hypothetical protein [Hufsiella arboris]|nr:hypothetical protein [Hufsiella arboris]
MKIIHPGPDIPFGNALHQQTTRNTIKVLKLANQLDRKGYM